MGIIVYRTLEDGYQRKPVDETNPHDLAEVGMMEFVTPREGVRFTKTFMLEALHNMTREGQSPFDYLEPQDQSLFVSDALTAIHSELTEERLAERPESPYLSELLQMTRNYAIGREGASFEGIVQFIGQHNPQTPEGPPPYHGPERLG